MIEFVLKNRKFRLHPDGIMYVRAHMNGVETKSEKWTEVKFCDCKGYKRCSITLYSIKTKLYMHRIVYYIHNPDWDIWDTSMDNMIDHINRNPSDNRIENLKIATHQENMWNTDHKGYCWHKATNKWTAQIRVNNKHKHLGLFEHEADARNAYIKAKAVLHKINLN